VWGQKEAPIETGREQSGIWRKNEEEEINPLEILGGH
jgi:hypothetical protein